VAATRSVDPPTAAPRPNLSKGKPYLH
jgi:hypothetical protein